MGRIIKRLGGYEKGTFPHGSSKLLAFVPVIDEALGEAIASAHRSLRPRLAKAVEFSLDDFARDPRTLRVVDKSLEEIKSWLKPR
jgi:hypothetical protein